MQFVSLFAAIFFLALLGKGILGYSLVVPFIFAFVFRVRPSYSIFVAFFSGLILSLVKGSLLGRESLALLVAAGVIQLYARRFSARHILFFVGFTAVGSVVYSLLVGRRVDVLGIILDMVLVVVFLPVVMWWKRVFVSDDIVLKL